MVKVNELKVDHTLIVKNFDTYRLSWHKFNISKESIPEGIRIQHPNEEQFSFLHHKEFSLHNHLYGDTWRQNDVYVITKLGKVKRALINFQIDKLFGIVDVWEIPKHCSVRSSNFNVSLSFPSPELALITDGNGFLYIIDTLDRNEINQWKTLHSEEVLGESREYKVICSQLEDEKSKKCRILHCILLLIEPSVQPTTDQKRSGFETVLKLATFIENAEGSWCKGTVNDFRGNSSVDYIALEAGCQGMFLITENEFKSSSSIEEHKSSNELNETVSEPDYHWQQANDEVKIWFKVPSCTNKSDLTIAAKSNSLEVRLKEDVVICGDLFQTIDQDLTIWTFRNPLLEIVLQKMEPGSIWKNLFLNDCDKIGEEVVNEEFASHIHQRLAHLCSENEEQGDAAILNSGELEECDAFGKTRYLWRYQVENCKITHKIILGGEQWLFPLQKADNNRLPAFCLRRDVDGLVWEPIQPKLDDDLFSCSHIHTFPALGYIAASRQDRKFLVSPPDLSYVAIINTVGHVIVFRKSNLINNAVVRNRKTFTVTDHSYDQHLINLETNLSTVGSLATNDYLFVLTSEQLLMININK